MYIDYSIYGETLARLAAAILAMFLIFFYFAAGRIFSRVLKHESCGRAERRWRAKEYGMCVMNLLFPGFLAVGLIITKDMCAFSLRLNALVSYLVSAAAVMTVDTYVRGCQILRPGRLTLPDKDLMYMFAPGAVVFAVNFISVRLPGRFFEKRAAVRLCMAYMVWRFALSVKILLRLKKAGK